MELQELIIIRDELRFAFIHLKDRYNCGSCENCKISRVCEYFVEQIQKFNDKIHKMISEDNYYWKG